MVGWERQAKGLKFRYVWAEWEKLIVTHLLLLLSDTVDKLLVPSLGWSVPLVCVISLG